MKNFNGNIGSRIYDLRRNLLQTQRDFAKKAGISQKMLSHYETGKTLPPIDILIKIAKYCSVSLDYLVLGKFDALQAKVEFYDDQIMNLVMTYNNLPKIKKNELKNVFKIILSGVQSI